jgi:hypothetical protein
MRPTGVANRVLHGNCSMQNRSASFRKGLSQLLGFIWFVKDRELRVDACGKSGITGGKHDRQAWDPPTHGPCEINAVHRARHHDVRENDVEVALPLLKRFKSLSCGSDSDSSIAKIDDHFADHSGNGIIVFDNQNSSFFARRLRWRENSSFGVKVSLRLWQRKCNPGSAPYLAFDVYGAARLRDEPENLTQPEAGSAPGPLGRKEGFDSP